MDRTRAPLRRAALAAALLVAAGAGTVVLLPRDEDPEPPGEGLRITYEVEDLTSGARSTEVVELDRPLRSRRLVGNAGSATTETGVYDRADGRWRQIAVVAPGEVGSDLRLAAALRWADRQSLTRQDGAGTVAGRPCTWWLTREPMDLAPFAPATASDSARSCVDGDGLLLADTWRAGGRDLRRRTATSVVRPVRVQVLDGPVEAIRPELVQVAVERREVPVDDLVVLPPPQGLRHVGAARVTELEPGTTTPVRRWERAVYVDAGDILVVDQVRGPLEVRGESVDLAPLGPARVQATGGGLVITVPLGPEQHLRVRSSMPYDVLRAWLVGLERR